MRSRAVVAPVLALGAVAAAGCSDDGDHTSVAPDASVEAWCEAFAETTSPNLDPEDDVGFDRLVDVAPGEIREASEVRAYAGVHC